MKINTFFLRVTSICNLDCDYCYVFKHCDNSWKNYPSIMSEDTVCAFSTRLKKYVIDNKLSTINIIFHGGEPLLFGEKNIFKTCNIINKELNNLAEVSYSIQTNGTLLNENFIKECQTRNIGISVSIDGHAEIHDKHRKYKLGKNSHKDVLNNIKILAKYPNVFDGVIGVIDPLFDPKEIFEFFSFNKILKIDLLLPDSTYLNPPKGREYNSNLYSDWLKDAFDSWFFNYQNIQFRTFEFILQGLLGETSSLDTFGLGSLDYLTIETDGSYHTSDILKITHENASFLNLFVDSCDIEKALNHENVKIYNSLLSFENLPIDCKNCIFSTLCGGGSLPHRYSSENQFNNKTIYCHEMFELISHIKKVLERVINNELSK
ncbi:MAG: radical SAM protein [Fusobacteriaceae bacterium]